EVASKLGASVVRVFSGRELPKDHTFDQVLEYMIPAFQECAEYGKQHGVIIGLQHHDDFLKTADQTIRVVKAVNSDWFSVILDVGSLRQGDPYEEIEKLLPYACTWQIKESVWYGQKSTPIDLARVRAIIGKVGFRGFLPTRSEEHTSELQSLRQLVCRLLLEKKKTSREAPPPTDHRAPHLYGGALRKSGLVPVRGPPVI